VTAAPPGDLTAILFRALYRDFALTTIGGLRIVTPKGTPVYISESLGQIARQLSAAPAPRPGPPRPAPPDRHQLMTSLPAPADAARLAAFLHRHPRWSAFWDKKYGLWRVAEDDPDSGLYAESPDLDTVITYITTRD
jgi:hypothetical protein